MKILEANAGALTNFEVLDFLRSRGASKDPTRVIAPVAASEYKVYDYLVESPVCDQTREKINEFFERSKRFNLAKAEVLNMINIRPSSLVEIDPIIELSQERFSEEQLDELVQLVVEVLPPLPTTSEPQEGMDEDKEETENQVDAGEQKEASGKEESDQDDEENEHENEAGEDEEENAIAEP